jgi:hypothetical protein
MRVPVTAPISLTLTFSLRCEGICPDDAGKILVNLNRGSIFPLFTRWWERGID